MAQNYTRQSSFADGDTITAALFNNEFNQVVNAFAYSASSDSSTGHKHDGTSGQGGNIPQIGDIDFLNKIVVDNTNNRWGFYVQVSGGTVEQLRIQDGAIVPVTNNDIDLGTSSLEFKDLFLDGTAHIDTLDVDVNATVAGTLGVTGASTLTGNVTATNDLSVGGNLTVTGNATIAGNLTFGDAATDTVAFSADVASNLLPSVDNTYDLGAAGSEWKDLYIDGTANIDSLVADTADINGGTIDGATIATSDITVGSGKTLNVSAGTLTLADDQISGDKVEGGTIAATTITTLTSTTVDTTNLEVTTLKAKDGTAAGSIADSTGVVTLASSVLTTTDINGGTIDGANITVGAAKTLDVSAGTLTLADNQISGDKVEGGTIAATTITALTFGSLNDGVVTVTAFADEDDMVSNSATLVPTQQSVKAYVDAQVTAQDLDIVGDTGTDAIDLDSETITFAGGTGITSVVTTGTVTHNIDSTVATLTGSQTLTNKSLTAPTLTGTAIVASLDISGDIDVDGTTNLDVVDIDGAVDFGSTTAHAGNATFADNAKAIFGAGSDLQIYHDGSDSYIKEDGTGNLIVGVDDFRLMNPAITKLMISANTDSYVRLYHAGDQKLATTSTGIDVTGTVTADGLTVDGVGALTSSETELLDLTSTGGDSLIRFGSLNSSFDARIGSPSNGSAAPSSLVMRTSGDDRLLIDGTTGDISFYEDTGTTESLIWDSSLTQLKVIGRETSRGSGVYAFDVDNSAHSSNLTLAGAMRVKGFYGDSFIVNGLGDVSFFDDSGTAKFFWDASAESLGIGNTVASSMDGGANNLVIGSGSGTEGMTIYSGTTNSGTIYFADGSSGDDRFRGQIGYSHSDNSLNFRTNASSSSQMTLDSSGNVGIGATPNQILTLDKASGDVFTRFDKSGAIQGLIGIADSAGSGSSASVQGDMIVRGQTNLLLDTTGTTRVKIDASGNVGIGTSSVSAPFHLKSSTANAIFLQENGSATTGTGQVGRFITTTSDVTDVFDSNGYYRIGNSTNPVNGAGFTEHMRIDASGNLLVGVTSLTGANGPRDTSTAAGLGVGLNDDGGVYSAAYQASPFVSNRISTDGELFTFKKDGAPVGSIGVLNGNNLSISGSVSNHTGIQFGTAVISPMKSGAENDGGVDLGFSNARFKNLYLSGTAYAGDLLVGNTITPSSNNQGAGFINTGASGLVQWQSGTTTTSSVSVARFYNPNGNVGSIQLAGTATSYVTSSDQRLKENITDADDAGAKIDAIQVRSFDWKADGSHQKYGMVAQELATVAPEAVSIPEDPEEMMGVDYSKLVPMMLKEIQSLRARVAQLES